MKDLIRAAVAQNRGSKQQPWVNGADRSQTNSCLDLAAGQELSYPYMQVPEAYPSLAVRFPVTLPKRIYSWIIVTMPVTIVHTMDAWVPTRIISRFH